MQNIFKQSGVKATDSFNQRFQRSIIRLTMLYAVTIAFLLVISGLISYSAFSARIGHRFNETPRIVIEIDQDIESSLDSTTPTPAQLREDLIESLLMVDVSLFILAVILSYWLAKKTLEPIKKTYETQQQFLGDASHELRTPLAILQMDLENELYAHARGDTAAITSKLEEVRRMSGLVDDILAVSRMDHETHTKSIHPVRITILPEVIATFKRLELLAKERGVTLVATEDTPGTSALLDTGLFSHVLMNVIKNAIMYNTPHGTVMVTIHQNKNQAVIRITDTGIGISPQDQAHIFDRFYRADKSRTRNNRGSGLGLSIVRTAVEKMHGSIHIQSELGKGTTVILTFPV